VGAAVVITTHDPREFIAEPPAGMANMVLVDPVALAEVAGKAQMPLGVITLYDVSIDEKRPATQEDVDALVEACARGVKLREGLKALIATGDASSIETLNALLATVEPKLPA
jgi:purine nucleoside phosphorylase